METASPRIRSLLRQADRVANAGKRAAAEKLYRQIIEEAPDTASAWLGLAEVVRSSAQKEQAYRHALELQPDSVAAQKGLAALHDEASPVDKVAIEPSENSRSGSLSAKADTKVPSQEMSAEEVGADHEIAEDSEFSNSRKEVGASDRLTRSASTIATTANDGQDVLEHEAVEGNEILICANHPGRKTHLRCNKCGKPICSSCARPTPVGYRCPECIREQEDIFYAAGPLDHVIAAIIAFPSGLVLGFFAARIGFFAIFLAAIAGSVLGRIVFRAAGRRRGRWLPHIVSAGIITGGLLFLVMNILLGNLIGGLFMGIYIITASGAAYYQMK